MIKRTMVIGLGPEYNYNKTDHQIWSENNTKYASNHGASLISRSLIKYFDATYIDTLDSPESYRKDYDLCVLAFATHITSWRDVSEYTTFIKALNIKTVAFSLGIQDYSFSTSKVNSLHPSMKELLQYVLSTSNVIGVRGPHTASILMEAGFKNKSIIRIGCPTIFNEVNRDLRIHKKEKFSNPIVVFHRTLGELSSKLFSEVPLLGQDFLDEAIFTNNLIPNNPMIVQELNEISKQKNGDLLLEQIKSNGIFPLNFSDWFSEIGKHDFVLGARLHGCIAALIQGVPAVMIARDIRVIEIAEFYKIPYVKYCDIGEMSIADIYNKADFTEFNQLYKSRFDNFVKLLSDLSILKRSIFHNQKNISKNYTYNEDDLSATEEILFLKLNSLNTRIDTLIESLHFFISIKNSFKENKLLKFFRNLIK